MGAIEPALAVRAGADGWPQAAASCPDGVADSLPHLAWASGAGGRWIWANRRWTEYTGQPGPEARGHGWLGIVHPDDREATLAAWSDADSAGRELRTEHRLRGADGRHRWFATRALPWREEGDSLGPHPRVAASWCGTSTEMDDARPTASTLRESEARFRGFAEAAPAVLWIIGEDGALEYLSPAYERVWGEPRDAVMRDLSRWADRLHPDDRAATLRALPRAFAGEREVVEYRIRRGTDGAVRWIRDAAFPIRDVAGRIRRVGGLAQDVTEERNAEQSRRILLDELNHRVKNALAGVQALAAQAARAGSDQLQAPAAAFRAFEERLFALARAHDLLTREAWQSASLADVVRETLAPHDARAGLARVVTSGPEVRLLPGAVVALHMALNELAANAATYGALTVEDGCVEVTWLVRRPAPLPDASGGGADDGVLELHWREHGGPPIASAPARRGFGSRLVEHGLSRQLGGQARLHFRPEGLEWRLRLPLSAKVEARGR